MQSLALPSLDDPQLDALQVDDSRADNPQLDALQVDESRVDNSQVYAPRAFARVSFVLVCSSLGS